MASKSKQARMQQAMKKESPYLTILVALATSSIALAQNRYGQFSDIRGYYGMRFSDGMHAWPFSYHTLIGTTDPVVPVQYPALMGLIMWLFSFLVRPSEFAWVTYFQLTAGVHILIFTSAAYIIFRLTRARYALIFSLTPAVIYSLNRNWDIWAVLMMLFAILLFEKKFYSFSAVALAASIATKFFPVVLLLPVVIFFARSKLWKELRSYLINVFGAWLLINIPFMLINLEGWFAFYKFNFEREIGSASLFEISSIFGLTIPSPDKTFYILNLAALAFVIKYLISNKEIVGIAEGSFFTMFAFILFNKQYSMQYVIWLTSLAVLAIFSLEKKNQVKVLVIYCFWQTSELVFQYSYFQHILTNAYKNSPTPASPEISLSLYGVTGIVRYFFAMLFTFTLAYMLNKHQSRVKR